MTLINEKTGLPLSIGDEVKTFRGDKCTITGWMEPHKPESTGRVYVRFVDQDNDESYFPGVIGAKFI